MADQSTRGRYSSDVKTQWKVGAILTLSVVAAAMLPTIGPMIVKRR